MQVSIFALHGTYLGIISLLIRLLWYPPIKRLKHDKYNFFISLTASLVLLLGIGAGSIF